MILVIISVVSLYFVITSIQNFLDAQKRVDNALERQNLLISKGCIETGRDPVTNNEIWNCPKGTNIPPLETN
jgi:hypothetical protein